MIKNIKKHEVLWGFGIISGLWALGIIFAGEIHFIDTIEFGFGSSFFSGIFPFAFSIVLTGIAYFSKRYGTQEFFKTSYIIASIPVVSIVIGYLITLFENNDVVFAIFGLPLFVFMLVGIPVTSSMGSFYLGDSFEKIEFITNYSDCICLGIFALSLIISMVCYLTVKEKDLSRPGIWC